MTKFIKSLYKFYPVLIILISVSLSAEPYTWKSVIAGGGGFVPGIIYHPAESGLAYARTDMGGAYRWNNATSQWVPITDSFIRTNADNMGILSIAIDPNDTDRVYMETGKYTQSWAGNGVFCASTNRGGTWTLVPLPYKVGGNEQGRGTGERLAVDPNLGSILFMGSTVDGMYKSVNYGTSWTKVAGGFTPTNVNFIIFDKASGALGAATPRIFAGVSDTTGQSLWRSTDGGATWAVVAGQPSGVMAFRADIAGANMFMTFANNSGPNSSPASGSVWKYNITGGTWQNISPIAAGYGFGGISVDAQNNNNIVVSTLGNWGPQDEIWRSTNGGTSWTALLASATWNRTYAPWTVDSRPHWVTDVKIDPFNSNKAIFVTGYGIWKTDNLSNMANTTWYFNDNVIEETVALQLISPSSGAHLLTAMGDIDGFRHDNLDVSPAQRYQPTRGTTLSIAYAENVPLKIVKGFNSAGYGSYSLDGGTTWTNFQTAPTGTSGGGSRAIAISANGNNIVWVPTGASGLYYSTNNGSAWTASTGGAPAGYEPAADRINSNKFYMFNGVDGRLWISVNGGQSFTQGPIVTTGGVDSWAASDGVAATAPGNEGHVWITTGRNGLYRSTDSGTTTTKVNTVTQAYRIGFGMAKPGNTYPAIFVYGIIGGSLGFYRSDDTGATWNRINDDNHQYGYVHQIIGDPRIYGRCYVSAEGRGAFYGDLQVTGSPTNTPTNTPFAGSPTSTPTRTRTATLAPTATITPTPAPVCSVINYDGETASTNVTSGATWISAGTAAEVTTFSHSATHSIEIHYVWPSGYYCGFGWNWAAWNAGDTYDASSASAIEFWVRTLTGTNTNLSVILVDSAAVNSNAVAVTGYLPGGVTTTWQKVTIPLSAFTTVNKAALWELSITTGGSDAGDQTIYLDDFSFVNPCGNTPTNTPSRTATPAFTRTNTPSSTLTRTATFTNTIPVNTPTFTATSSSTNTQTTIMNSPTFTPTRTWTLTASPTQTHTAVVNTQTFTITVLPPTFTSTNTLMAIFTPTRTATITVTPTLTNTATSTPTYTITRTRTVSPTETPFAGSPTGTPTLTQTNTITMSPTLMDTATVTPTQDSCACPSYFGRESLAVVSGNYNVSGYIESNIFTLAEDANVRSLSMKINTTTGGNVRMAIYSDYPGAPAALIVESNSQPGVPGWNTLDIPDTYLAAGTYWIAWQVEAGTFMQVEAGTGVEEGYVSSTYMPFPALFPAGDLDVLKFMVKADYCPVICGTPTFTGTITATTTPTPTVSITPTYVGTCACPDVFGKSYISGNATNAEGYVFANWYGISEDGNASAISINVASGTGSARVALYTNSTGGTPGVPVSLLCESAETAVVPGMNTINIPQAGLGAGQVYWIAFQVSTGIILSAEAAPAGDLYFIAQAFGPFPGNMSGATGAAFSCDVQVHYCPVVCPVTPSETATITPSETVFLDTPTSTYTSTLVISTPTTTPTTYSTFVPTECSFDDMEDQNAQNNLSGYWYTYYAGNGASVYPAAPNTMTPQAGGANSTAYAQRISGTVGTESPDYPSIGTGSQLTSISGAPLYNEVDLSACTGLKFYVKGDSKNYYIKVPYTNNSGATLTAYNDYKYSFIAAATWSQVVAPFASFTQATGWGTSAALSAVLTHAKEFQWQTDFYAATGTTTADLWIDEIVIYGCDICSCCAPTIAIPTFTETFTATLTPTTFISFTPTQTRTQTIPASATITQTTAPSLTATSTHVYTVSSTTTLTETPVINTPTITPVLTPIAVATTSIIEIKNPLPYPNPRNASSGITIGYQLTRDAVEITFKLYTTNARLVRKHTINGTVSAGIKAMPVSAAVFENLSQGVYFYVIEGKADNGTVGRSKIDKIIIIK